MITSLTNPRVKEVKSLHRQRVRQQTGLFLVEGLRLVEEALRAGHVPALVFFTPRLEESPRGSALLTALQDAAVQPAAVSERVMQAMATTATPQSVVAVCRVPDLRWPQQPTSLLILDRLRDPGNMGSVLRTAEAAGVEGVILSPGTADAFNPKVVRGGMGAHFRLSMRSLAWAEIGHAVRGLRVWVADVRGVTPYYQADWKAPWALIVGGEAAGSSVEAQALVSGRVCIPMPGQAESLNAVVAAGIILFEAVRQRSFAQKAHL